MTFSKWLDALVNEKGFDLDLAIEVVGPTGIMNHIPLECLLLEIKAAPDLDQARIKSAIVMLDFKNANILDYFKHLAKAIAI